MISELCIVHSPPTLEAKCAHTQFQSGNIPKASVLASTSLSMCDTAHQPPWCSFGYSKGYTNVSSIPRLLLFHKHGDGSFGKDSVLLN